MSRNQVFGTLALLGAALLIGAVMTGRWISSPVADEISIDLGLRSMKMCKGDVCQDVTYRVMFASSNGFVHLGRLTFGLGLLTAALLAVVAMLGYRDDAAQPVSLARVAVLLALASIGSAVAFVLARPTGLGEAFTQLGLLLDGSHMTKPWSQILYYAGCVIGGGAAAATLLEPTVRPRTRSLTPAFEIDARPRRASAGAIVDPRERSTDGSAGPFPAAGGRSTHPSAPPRLRVPRASEGAPAFVELDGVAPASTQIERSAFEPRNPWPKARASAMPPISDGTAAAPPTPSSSSGPGLGPRPPCPTCGSGMIWMPGDSRHYCRTCKAYQG